MKTLLLSGDTLQEWDVQEMLKPELSTSQIIERLLRDDWDNKVSRCGLTYLEIEQLNNTYNK